MNAIATIPSFDLDNVLGGAGVGANINADVKLDGNQAIRDVGTGAGRLIGCGFGANSFREFGNCMLTGQLGNVPK